MVSLAGEKPSVPGDGSGGLLPGPPAGPPGVLEQPWCHQDQVAIAVAHPGRGVEVGGPEGPSLPTLPQALGYVLGCAAPPNPDTGALWGGCSPMASQSPTPAQPWVDVAAIVCLHDVTTTSQRCPPS